jgi:hypothetical protein
MQSDSDSDSSIELSSSFKNLRGQLRKLDNDFEESIYALKSFRHKVKDLEKHIEQPKLEYEYPLLHKYLPIWKKENRLNYNGSKVLLTKKEAKLFNLSQGWVSVYDICKGLKTN